MYIYMEPGVLHACPLGLRFLTLVLVLVMQLEKGKEKKLAAAGMLLVTMSYRLIPLHLWKAPPRTESS